jgi:adenosine deaminase
MDTLLDVARQHGLTIPYTHFNSLVQMQKDDPQTLTNFLAKFQTLRMFYRSPEVIARITREAIADAAADGVRYLELRFTPVALSRMQGFALNEVMDWVTQSAAESSHDYHLPTNLIASVNRHEPVELAEQVARLALDYRDRGIVGLDLAGNEADFSAQPFAGVFREAKASGLHTTVHAGEWSGAESVREAVEYLEAERIGHGVRVVENPLVMDMARERGAFFEVCITSNHQSGVVSEIKDHPIQQMVLAGLKTTINTDDPGISRITLTDEFRLAMETIGMPATVLSECILNGARAAFIPPAQQQELADSLSPILRTIFQLF